MSNRKAQKRTGTSKAFQDLTWSDLEAWAGARIVSRGMSYKKGRFVSGLTMTHDKCLLASVRGTRNYVTKVSLDKGRLSSVCTCPYRTACKHAVAVVLEFLDLVENNSAVPFADEDDERLLLLEDASMALDDDEDDMDDDEFDPDLDPDIDSSLEKKSRKELQTMLSEILNNHPELTKKIRPAPSRPAKKGCAALVKAVTKSIVIKSSEQGWRNYWKHTGHTPDYSSVRLGFERLLDEGCADDAVRLGEKLFVKGTEQVEQSQDEGETADEIANTMSLVFKALAKCSLPDVDRLERAVDFGLRDEYGLCRGLDEFLGRRFAKSVWSDLANRLFARLKDLKPDSKEDLFFRHYKRDHLSDELIRALENAGRKEEALSICFREAETTGSFERLVRKLRKAGRSGEAEEWIRRGVTAMQDRLPGIVSSLKKELLDIRQRKGDWLFVAALHVDEFCMSPSLENFKEVRKACEKAKVWQAVRQTCLEFLETGNYPGSGAGWPLPDTGFAKQQPLRRGGFPFTDILLEIAVHEKRVEDVLHLYDQHKSKTKGWTEARRDDMVAEAIVKTHPEKAIEIWKKLAEEFIAQTNVGAYGEAVTYLKKVRNRMQALGRDQEWSVYLNDLNETNRRKTRLVQMLNALSGRPIISR